MNISVKINIPPGFEDALEAELEEAMRLTMEDFRDDVITSQTMPKDGSPTGLQSETHYEIGKSKEFISGYLITDTPYARYQYHGMTEPKDGKPSRPFNYQTGYNPYARSKWLEPYVDGKFLQERFTENLREVRKGK